MRPDHSESPVPSARRSSETQRVPGYCVPPQRVDRVEVQGQTPKVTPTVRTVSHPPGPRS